MAVDVHQVEVGNCRVAHGLARRSGLELLHWAGPGVGVNGQDLVRLELIALAADAAAKAGLFGQSNELLQERVVGLHLTLLVGLQPDGLELLRSHGHGQFLLLGLGAVSHRLDLFGEKNSLQSVTTRVHTNRS